MLQGTAAIALATMMLAAPTPGEPALNPIEPSPPPEPAAAPIEQSERSEPPAPVLEPAAPDPALAPVQAPAPGPTVAVASTQERRMARPTRDGRGLLIAAGVMGALNIGIVATRFALDLGEVSAEQERARILVTVIATPLDVAAGVGLTAAGGTLRGRSDAYRTTFDGAPKLRAKAFTVSGMFVLVMGAVAWASAWTPWHGDVTLGGRGRGTLVVESIGSLLIMGGSGLVAYGVAWEKTTARYARALQIGLRPSLGPGFAGLALGGRF